MTIKFAILSAPNTTIIYTDQIHISCTEKGLEQLQEIFMRAMNCHDRAHPDLKVLADLVTMGKPMQDYHSQEGMESPRIHVCGNGK